MSNDDNHLTPEEAEALLAEGEYIHTFTRRLIGADHPRADIIAMLHDPNPKTEIVWAGAIAASMDHRIAVIQPDGYVLFIATKKEHVDA